MAQSLAIDTHEAALEFLWRRINYERQPMTAYGERHFKLARMQTLLDRLGNPERRMPIVHLAGTKGKGSTAAMTAAVLTAAGFRTGVYSSPHLERVEERIAIGGVPISPDELTAFVGRIAPLALQMDRETARQHPDETGPTYFELLTAMAFDYFAARGVQFAVVEVGLGGRLDSTNVCRPRVTAITSISRDHTQLLGNSLGEIAQEKAGIAKSGVPLISGVSAAEAAGAIARIARERQAPLIELGRDFGFDYRPANTAGFQGAHLDGWVGPPGDRWQISGLQTRLLGEHQAANAAVTLAIVDQLRRQGWRIADEAVRQGLRQAQLPARVEVVGQDPVVILDGAHNEASIAALVATLDEHFPARPRWLVFGTTQDKDLGSMLRHLLPAFSRIAFTRYCKNPRSVPLDDLASQAAAIEPPRPDRQRWTFDEPGQAWHFVQQRAEPHELICITGSFFLAAELRGLVQPACSPGWG